MIGDIILVKNTGLISKLIRWFTKAEYNHVAVVVGENNLVEANFRGVHKLSISEYISNPNITYKFVTVKDITLAQREIVARFALSQVGQKYDYAQFICVALFYWGRQLRRLEPIDLKGWICSELVAESFYEVGIKFSDTIDPDNITPNDIANSPIIVEV